jgi:hypothetical protein
MTKIYGSEPLGGLKNIPYRNNLHFVILLRTLCPNISTLLRMIKLIVLARFKSFILPGHDNFSIHHFESQIAES